MRNKKGTLGVTLAYLNAVAMVFMWVICPPNADCQTVADSATSQSAKKMSLGDYLLLQEPLFDEHARQALDWIRQYADSARIVATALTLPPTGRLTISFANNDSSLSQLSRDQRNTLLALRYKGVSVWAQPGHSSDPFKRMSRNASDRRNMQLAEGRGRAINVLVPKAQQLPPVPMGRVAVIYWGNNPYAPATSQQVTSGKVDTLVKVIFELNSEVTKLWERLWALEDTLRNGKMANGKVGSDGKDGRDAHIVDSLRMEVKNLRLDLQLAQARKTHVALDLYGTDQQAAGASIQLEFPSGNLIGASADGLDWNEKFEAGGDVFIGRRIKRLPIVGNVPLSVLGGFRYETNLDGYWDRYGGFAALQYTPRIGFAHFFVQGGVKWMRLDQHEVRAPLQFRNDPLDPYRVIVDEPILIRALKRTENPQFFLRGGFRVNLNR